MRRSNQMNYFIFENVSTIIKYQRFRKEYSFHIFLTIVNVGNQLFKKHVINRLIMLINYEPFFGGEMEKDKKSFWSITTSFVMSSLLTTKQQPHVKITHPISIE